MNLRGYGHWRHLLQRSSHPRQIVVQGTSLRIGAQGGLEFGARRGVELAVDPGVNQFYGAFVGHIRTATWL